MYIKKKNLTLDKDMIFSMAKLGLSLDKIAKALNISPGYLSIYVRAHWKSGPELKRLAREAALKDKKAA